MSIALPIRVGLVSCTSSFGERSEVVDPIECLTAWFDDAIADGIANPFRASDERREIDTQDTKQHLADHTLHL